jgi:outer membrane protein TolC
VLCAAVVSTGCVGPAYHAPRAPAPVAAAYKEATRGMWKLATPSDSIPRGRWWEMFHELEHAIATLLGVPATDFTMPQRALTAKPPRIPAGAPSQLLERRPDIAAAERQMASANAVIGIGYTAYYPLVTLTGSAGFQRSTLHSLFDWPSRIWSLGASLAETVFDGGYRRASIDQAIAAYHASVASYRQTVLAAFQQVEDDLAATRIIGMLPMALGLGEGGEQNAPLGRAVIGGLLFATVSTLLFVPSFFSLLHGWRTRGAGPRSGDSHAG